MRLEKERLFAEKQEERRVRKEIKEAKRKEEERAKLRNEVEALFISKGEVKQSIMD